MVTTSKNVEKQDAAAQKKETAEKEMAANRQTNDEIEQEKYRADKEKAVNKETAEKNKQAGEREQEGKGPASYQDQETGPSKSSRIGPHTIGNPETSGENQ